MSSDSDDLDEDELLQMALKEQQQRDVNYLTNSRKPVANYVQPPSQSRKSAAAASVSKTTASSAQSKGARRVVDDDDDSEVEMLSISSGDEDSTRDHRTSAATRGGRASRSTGKEDDMGWDGEEPHCWKHVDEDEVPLNKRYSNFASTFLSCPAFTSSFKLLGECLKFIFPLVVEII